MTLFLVIGFIFPAGYLLGLIPAKVAFPTIFICFGSQQLFNGLIIKPKNKLSISFGILFIIFAVFIVIPTYYFK